MVNYRKKSRAIKVREDTLGRLLDEISKKNRVSKTEAGDILFREHISLKMLNNRKLEKLRKILGGLEF